VVAVLGSAVLQARGGTGGAASPDRMQSGVGGANHTFTFRLPAVGEAGFKWQVTFNFEARLLAICAGLFFVGLSSPARWNSVRCSARLTGRDLERSPLAAVQGQGLTTGSAGARRPSIAAGVVTASGCRTNAPINHRL
jgi:hypothetical protein